MRAKMEGCDGDAMGSRVVDYLGEVLIAGPDGVPVVTGIFCSVFVGNAG